MWAEVSHFDHGRFDAKRSAAADPDRDQRPRGSGHPQGGPRCATRIAAPQGTRNFDERSDAEVYGATPCFATKETATLPKGHRGGGLLVSEASPSGESPKASRCAATKSMHASMSVEGGEA